jgi:TonB family protein
MSESIINYILRSSLSLALLYLFFTLFLGKDKMHIFNRFYLIASLIFSFAIPLLTIPAFFPSTTVTKLVDVSNLGASHFQINTSTLQQESQFNFGKLIPILYFSISLLFLIRFIFNLIRLEISKSINPSIDYKGYRIVLIKDMVLPYSFLSTIYVNSVEYKAGRIPKELFAHEISHISQRHSLDIIFIEFLKVFFWFNPLIYLFKKVIMLNHEYLADTAVTYSENNTSSYINILLNIAFRNNNSYLASSFNYSFTKKRLLMITKNKFSKTAIVKRIAVLPLFLLLGLLVINAQETKFVRSTWSTPPAGFFDFKSQTGKPSLIFIDGIISNIDINKIDLATIERVVVYKDEIAVKKFGYKGKDGVIEFTSRKMNSKIPKDQAIFAEVSSIPLNPKDTIIPFFVVEEMPKFMGGGDDLMIYWISRNLKYPQEAVKQKIEGKVTVTFYIDTKGKPQNIEVIKSTDSIFDAEATRVISSLPEWTPGRQRGVPVNVHKETEIIFKL